MEIILGGRRYGKTTKALEWLKQAQRTDTYPFWDRVLLVQSLDYAQRLRVDLRKEAEARDEVDFSLYYNLVYSWNEWATAHLGIQPVKVFVDNADWLLYKFLAQFKGMVEGFTFNIDDRDNLTVLGPPPGKEDFDAKRKH